MQSIDPLQVRHGSGGDVAGRYNPSDDRVASGARAALLSRLERQPVVDAGRWTRDELYEDEA